VVQGNADFRPTGMAVAPDGSIYFGDWVLRDYEVHGHGRVWRLALPKDDLAKEFPPVHEDADLPSVELADSDDPFERAQAVWQLSQLNPGDPVIAITPGLRLAVLQSLRLRKTNDAKSVETILRAALRDESPDVRLYAVRWIADQRLTALRDDVEKLLEGPLPSPRYYLAVLGAVDWLDHDPELRNVGINDALLVRELGDENRSPAVHALALQLISPEDKFLTTRRLAGYLQDEYEPLRLEAVRTLAQQTRPDRFALLESTVRDPAQSDAVRVEALVGLAAAADRTHDVLEGFAEDQNPVLRREAERQLRLAGLRPVPAEAKPPADDLAAWDRLLAKPGDFDAGRRLFFSSVGPRCSVCHEYDGRGGRVGPDLTHISRSSSRERIIASILQPSQDIAPHFQSWVLVTKDGKTRTGLRLAKAGDDGIELYVDSEGHEFSLSSDAIETRRASSTSIMPDGLENTLSIDDLRDLVTFLAAPAPEAN
jgi:putative heme-binding domain-containing protein